MSAECFDTPQAVCVRYTYDNCRNGVLRKTVGVSQFAGGAYDKSAGQWAIEFRDRLWAITQFKLAGRENLNGRASIVFSFRTEDKADFDEPNEQMLKWALKTEGRVWFDEADKTLVKVEGEYYKDSSITKGFFTPSLEFRKGSSWRWEMEKLDDQAWLPKYTESLYKGTYFFSTFYDQSVTRYSNYRKRSAPQP